MSKTILGDRIFLEKGNEIIEMCDDKSWSYENFNYEFFGFFRLFDNKNICFEHDIES